MAAGSCLVAGQWGTALSSLLACPQEEQKLLICSLSWAQSQGWIVKLHIVHSNVSVMLLKKVKLIQGFGAK